jgi:glycine/serine hydroxymethyltransferase
MKEEEIKKAAGFVCSIYDLVKHFEFSKDKEVRLSNLREFREFIKDNKDLQEIKKEVKKLCLKFPIYK